MADYTAGARPSAAQAQLIEDLGGVSKLARILSQRMSLKLTPQRVFNWKSRGIPYRFREAIKLESRRRGVSLPAGFMGGGQHIEPSSQTIEAERELPYL